MKKNILKGARCFVAGGMGFIGHHLVNKLISCGAKVMVLDNLLSGDICNLNPKAYFIHGSVRNLRTLQFHTRHIDYAFNLAAIARTPWCIDDPILCYDTNVMGAANLLEACRQNNVRRIVQASSNVVYAFDTPYRTSKEAVERLGDTYIKMFGKSIITLRFSNVYGPGQSEEGPSPNVFAALRKSKRELGHLVITGDGAQSRDYTHVYDIVDGILAACASEYNGVLDLCTGINTSLNDVAKYFKCPVKYADERPGDIKHIRQDPDKAMKILGWRAKILLKDGIKDVL